MAKELPYFRFEPSEWDNGNIQICSRESKGLFIDLCSIYWSRLGELPYALALQKLCNGKEDALQELKNAEIFGVIDGQIVIEFLDEQLSERGQTSEKRRVAAKKRWSDASALQMQSKSNAKRREEKRREEKKIEEKEDPLRAFLDLLSGDLKIAYAEWIQYRKELGKKITPSTAKKQIRFLGGRDPAVSVAIINQSIENGWTGLFELKSTFNGNGKQHNGLTKVQQQQANNLQALRDQSAAVFGKQQ